MQIGIWLKRLALPQRYGAPLAEIKVIYVSDLKSLSEGDVLDVMDVKNQVHKARISGFLSGDSIVTQMVRHCCLMCFCHSYAIAHLLKRCTVCAGKTKHDQTVV